MYYAPRRKKHLTVWLKLWFLKRFPSNFSKEIPLYLNLKPPTQETFYQKRKTIMIRPTRCKCNARKVTALFKIYSSWRNSSLIFLRFETQVCVDSERIRVNKNTI